jgi:hypothetical protein
VTVPFEPPSGYPQPPAYGQPPPYGQPPVYGQPSPYGYPGYGGYPPALRNGLGTAALVLGILGAVCGLTLFGFFLAFPLGVLAVIFGLIGRGRAKRHEATNNNSATWGLCLGIAALVMSAVGLVFVIHVVRDQNACRDRAVTQQDYINCDNNF